MINRDNYEEFLILYWDNELDAQQRAAVEAFINQNPDLRDEFSLIGNLRFSPSEEINFNNKDSLLKDVYTPDNSEAFLLYLDNELNEEERLKFEQHLAGSTEARKQLAGLQQTKLDPETILFPHKETLYRYPARVRSFVWMRAAAAVLLIAGASYFGVQYFTHQPDPVNPPVAVQKESEKKQTPKEELSQDIQLAGASEMIVETQSEKSIKQKPQSTKKSFNSDPQNQLLATNLPAQQEVQVLIPEIEEPADTRVSKMNVITHSIDPSDVTERNSPALNLKSSFAVNKDVEETRDNGGLKGFLRKATRMLERRTNIPVTNEDDKLLVGAFAVSLK